jgi:hypothetical protein
MSRLRDAAAAFCDTPVVANGLLLEDAKGIARVVSPPPKCAVSSNHILELTVQRFSIKSVAS